jgi:hypothetical protein
MHLIQVTTDQASFLKIPEPPKHTAPLLTLSNVVMPEILSKVRGLCPLTIFTPKLQNQVLERSSGEL